jgi:hypothetical protein
LWIVHNSLVAGHAPSATNTRACAPARALRRPLQPGNAWPTCQVPTPRCNQLPVTSLQSCLTWGGGECLQRSSTLRSLWPSPGGGQTPATSRAPSLARQNSQRRDYLRKAQLIEPRSRVTLAEFDLRALSLNSHAASENVSASQSDSNNGRGSGSGRTRARAAGQGQRQAALRAEAAGAGRGRQQCAEPAACPPCLQQPRPERLEQVSGAAGPRAYAALLRSKLAPLQNARAPASHCTERACAWPQTAPALPAAAPAS